MPVRLTKAYSGQAAGTLYWGADQATLRNTGLADDAIESATDYEPWTRIVTAATAIVSANALKYRMNSGNAQTLTLNQTGYFPVGTVLTVEQMGAGATTVVAGSGVTINQGNGVTSLITKGQNYIAQLEKVGANTWTAFGGFGG